MCFFRRFLFPKFRTTQQPDGGDRWSSLFGHFFAAFASGRPYYYFHYLTKNPVCSATSSTKKCRRLGPPAKGCECIPIQNKGTTRSISTIPSCLLRENKIEWHRREKRPAGKAELPPCFGARSSEVQADMDESAPFQCSKASTIQQACQEFGGVVQKCFDHV